MMNNKITLFVLTLLFSGSNQATADEIHDPENMNYFPDTTDPENPTDNTGDDTG